MPNFNSMDKRTGAKAVTFALAALLGVSSVPFLAACGSNDQTSTGLATIQGTDDSSADGDPISLDDLGSTTTDETVTQTDDKSDGEKALAGDYLHVFVSDEQMIESTDKTVEGDVLSAVTEKLNAATAALGELPASGDGDINDIAGDVLYKYFYREGNPTYMYAAVSDGDTINDDSIRVYETQTSDSDGMYKIAFTFVKDGTPTIAINGWYDSASGLIKISSIHSLL